MMNLNRRGPQLTPPSLDPPSPRRRPEAGTGRLGVISSYFQLSGIAAGITTVPLAIATFFPRALPSLSSRQVVPFVGCALLAFGFLRTSRLLDQRRRSGALLAAFCFLASLLTIFAKNTDWLSVLNIGASVVGLALVASVWTHLEKD